MKKSALITFCCVLTLGIGLPSAPADPKSDLVEKYYRSFRGTDGTGGMVVWSRFNAEVPASDQGEILACMLDRATQDPEGGSVVEFVLTALLPSGGVTTWSTHLETAVLSKANHKDWSVRELLPEVLAGHDKVKYRNPVLSYLDDPNPRVQYSAVSAVRTWPDAEVVLNAYVQKNSAGPSQQSDAVKRAKQIILNKECGHSP